MSPLAAVMLIVAVLWLLGWLIDTWLPETFDRVMLWWDTRKYR